MQQQHLMQMQPMMAAYYPNNVTTDHIQQYLDENKSLILKIVESQNSGKLSECAENQARLQRNLMYLAAIADSQPQPPSMAGQYQGGGMMQQGGPYAAAQQAAQQMAQMTQQQLMAARSSLLYAQQQPYAALQQQGLHGGQLGMSSSSGGGGGGLHMLHGEASSGNIGGGYPDFVRGSGTEGRSIIGSSSSKQEMGEGRGGGGGSSSGHTGEGGETIYLKSADE
ncbi:GRF1-interacting factor 1 [Stylosanthes scabra]|uniref:GRF1-interacting factor 1 n=1 Tax=Stylosanthes scabra TaxID=79078 RepID=A0ABU6W5X5_9FABA|nr:GRF1-interacting factor 1 [Stylosanthes scabra]